MNYIGKLNRHVNMLVIHCAATKPDMNIGVKEIRDWHVRGNGWRDIGYHLVIRRDGTIERGRPMENIGSHVRGHNGGSIGVCLVGGVDNNMKARNNFTAAQWISLELIVSDFQKNYPNARICGHRDLDKGKECPSFDVSKWLARIGRK